MVSAILLPLTVSVHELSITSVIVYQKARKVKAVMGVDSRWGQEERLYCISGVLTVT